MTHRYRLAEIAKFLGVAPSTVSKALSRARPGARFTIHCLTHRRTAIRTAAASEGRETAVVASVEIHRQPCSTASPRTRRPGRGCETRRRTRTGPEDGPVTVSGAGSASSWRWCEEAPRRKRNVAPVSVEVLDEISGARRCEARWPAPAAQDACKTRRTINYRL